MQTNGTSRAPENTDGERPLATVGDDQAEEQMATLGAPGMASFPSGWTGPTRR